MAFPLAVFEAVRDVWPAHKPLGVRMSATDWIEGGWSLDDSVTFAKALKSRGCDYVAASSGGTLPVQHIPVGPGYQVHLASGIRKEAGIPAMAVGMINSIADAELIIKDGKADLIAMGRGMTYDPRRPWHAAAELGATIAYPPQYARSDPSMRTGDPLKISNPSAE
jgi:NADPH2 dehydrogenase